MRYLMRKVRDVSEKAVIIRLTGSPGCVAVINVPSLIPNSIGMVHSGRCTKRLVILPHCWMRYF